MIKYAASVPEEELDEIATAVSDILPSLRESRIYLTGGTGFFGTWLLETILHLNRTERLRVDVTILTRDPVRFLQRLPHFSQAKELTFVRGNVVDKREQSATQFDYCIHAATTVSHEQSPRQTLDEIVKGTENTLVTAASTGVKRFLYISSGAVYGIKSRTGEISESSLCSPDTSDIRDVYGEGKRVGEFLCSIFQAETSLQCTIARCFAFVGPHMSFDGRFAAGNFIRDAVTKNSIVVDSDGSPIRSYMYPTDLVVWLLKILVKGETRKPYNVGSQLSINLATLAEMIASLSGASCVLNKDSLSVPGDSNVYLPCTRRAREELMLSESTTIETILTRTICWYRENRKKPQ